MLAVLGAVSVVIRFVGVYFWSFGDSRMLLDSTRTSTHTNFYNAGNQASWVSSNVLHILVETVEGQVDISRAAVIPRKDLDVREYSVVAD